MQKEKEKKDSSLVSKAAISEGSGVGGRELLIFVGEESHSSQQGSWRYKWSVGFWHLWSEMIIGFKELGGKREERWKIKGWN